MFVKIPFASRSEGHEGLRYCIKQAAEGTGFNEFQVAQIMSFFFRGFRT